MLKRTNTNAPSSSNKRTKCTNVIENNTSATSPTSDQSSLSGMLFETSRQLKTNVNEILSSASETAPNSGLVDYHFDLSIPGSILSDSNSCLSVPSVPSVQNLNNVPYVKDVDDEAEYQPFKWRIEGRVEGDRTIPFKSSVSAALCQCEDISAVLPFLRPMSTWTEQKVQKLKIDVEKHKSVVEKHVKEYKDIKEQFERYNRNVFPDYSKTEVHILAREGSLRGGVYQKECDARVKQNMLKKVCTATENVFISGREDQNATLEKIETLIRNSILQINKVHAWLQTTTK